MKHIIEIDNIPDFKKWISRSPLVPAAIQDLNLLKFESKFEKLKFLDCLFLGCLLSKKASGHIVHSGGIVIPDSSHVSFEVHRAKLYTPEDLFKGFKLKNKKGYQLTQDYKIYIEYIQQGMENPPSIYTSLMRRLHDHSITDALHEAIENKKVVAIMGGHGMERQDPVYSQIAFLARKLTRLGFLMVSGGGPGAMEATHLGAYFSGRKKADLIQAINMMKKRPKNGKPNQEFDDSDWLHRAWRVREKFPIKKGKEASSMSIGIPTWLYGHEPPAVFATHIAKYFANSVREDGLLRIAKHGVIFAPGSAGTTQEIFQDACQNHYAPYNKAHMPPKFVSPMILLGKQHWTKKIPAWPLLRQNSENRMYGELVHLTDETNEIVDLICKYNPAKYQV